MLQAHNALPKEGVFMRQSPNLNKRALIFANGSQIDLPAVAAMIAPGDLLVAADGGLRFLDALGRAPDLLIGDLDSIDRGRIDLLRAGGTRVEQHPERKNATDLELAIQAALGLGCRVLIIVGGLGGRLDMTLANIFLLLQIDAAIDARLDDGLEEVFLIQAGASGGRRIIEGSPGDRVSLLAAGIPARGITTQELEYPLRGETLFPEHSRGISNRLLEARAEVALESGVLICIHTRQAAQDAPSGAAGLNPDAFTSEGESS